MARVEATVLCDWGPDGARHLEAQVGVLVIVDVLSFSTAVDVAVARGAVVYPHAARDLDAVARDATVLGAEVAGPRGSRAHRYSLSPVSLASIASGTTIVLPSPNGSAISAQACKAHVLAGCLRNARAVAARARSLAAGGSIAVIAAGERWPSGGLRPAIEDLIGAGAIIEALDMAGSDDAEVARQTYRAARPTLREHLLRSMSGRELIARGYAQDVDMAGDINASSAAPLLVEGIYRAG